MDDIIAEFISETREMLEHISGELVAWERNPNDRERLDEIFRFVHTVKGSSGFLNLPRHEQLSHAAEDALGALRAGSREPNAALVSAILAIIDRIGALTEALEGGEEVAGDDGALITALSRCSSTDHDHIASSAPAPTAPRGPVRSIRVPVELLDQLMAGVSDLVLSRNEFARRLASGDDRDLDLAFERLSSSITDLRDRISWTRMQRIESLFAALPRLVRDLSNQLGKSVALDLDGADVELDREMIEMLRDPLTHIVRNALDHGIEPGDARSAAGKDEEGRLTVSARQTGNRIEIAISDDGSGIDCDRLRQKAVDTGLITSTQAAQLSESECNDLIFHAGLTTADEVSEISGRGVGMDVVRTNVERLGGTIAVESAPETGTIFRLNVPLTLTIIPALVIGCGGLIYAIPRPMIGEIVALASGAAAVETVGDSELLALRGEHMPLVRLAALFGCEVEAERFAVIVTPRKGQRYALAVGEMRGHEDLVVKPLAPIVMDSGLFAGSALPDTGQPLLLVDIAGIAAKAGLRLQSAESRTSDLPTMDGKEDSDIKALIFDDLDGRKRAVRIGIVDRVMKVDAALIAESAGVLRLTLDGEILPVIANGALPETGPVSLMRLTDGTTDIVYATRGPADVATLGSKLESARVPGPIAAVVIHDDQPIEIIDSHHLFARFAHATPSAPRSLCRIVGGDDHWRREILGPLVKLAGYDVVFDAEASEDAISLVIEAETDDTLPHIDNDSVLRLSDHPGAADSVFKYDREGILEALQSHRRTGGRR